MSRDQPHPIRPAPAAAVLAGLAAYPIAAAVQPGGEPAAWAAAIAAAIAVVAALGTARRVGEPTRPDVGGRVPPPHRWGEVVGLIVVGGGTDLLVRAALRLLVGAPLDATLVGIATVVVGILFVAGWRGGGWLAQRVSELVDGGVRAPPIQHVGRGLLAVGGTALAAAGWVQRGDPTAALTAPAIAIAAYAIVAFLFHQRLRRAALVADWHRSGRLSASAITARWGAWGALVVLLGATVAALWLSPPAAPARHAAEQVPAGVSQLLDRLDEARMTREDVQRDPEVAGGGIPGRDASELDEDRTVSTVEEVVDWLLRPAAGFGEGEPRFGDGPRPDSAWDVAPQLLILVALIVGVGVLVYRAVSGRGRPGRAISRALATVWALVRHLLAVMFRWGPDPSGDAGVTDDPAVPADRRVRAATVRWWRRPDAPEDQVKYDYLRVLDRAERRGLPRRREESPVRYAEVLRPVVPEHADAVDEITDRFVEARYSHHAIGPSTAEQTRELSRALRRALKDRPPAERT